MFTTLRTKLAIMLFGLLGLLGILHTVWMVRTSRFYLQEVNQRLERGLAEHLADERVVSARGLIDKDAASETFRTLMLINRNIEVYLLDPDGRILAFSAPPGTIKREFVHMEPVRRFLAGDEFPIFGDDPRDLARQKVFSVAQVRPPSGGRGTSLAASTGFLYVILLGDEYGSPFHLLSSSQILRSSVWALGASVAIGLIASLFTVRVLTRRLSCLGREMRDFRTSGFEALPASDPPVSASGDEIDRLCVTFREMAQKIHEQIGQLTENDRRRRELIANVSHDLRTPLQSLQGYIETLLAKEHTLAPVERRRYLETAVKQCTGLNTLISQLFELAKLESKDMQPSKEAFSVCELAQDIGQRFELLAREHGLHLHTSLDRDVPQVIGDIALIERVLVNVIENAIQHTPEGGSVALGCHVSGTKVLTCVSDTGPGIAAADLPHIFERFYRAASDSRPRADGAGLGLAISQRILQLHGSSLRVDATEEGGAIFCFDLQKAEPAPTKLLAETKT